MKVVKKVVREVVVVFIIIGNVVNVSQGIVFVVTLVVGGVVCRVVSGASTKFKQLNFN